MVKIPIQELCFSLIITTAFLKRNCFRREVPASKVYSSATEVRVTIPQEERQFLTFLQKLCRAGPWMHPPDGQRKTDARRWK